MAKCKACQGEMNVVSGCTVKKVHIDGKVYDRIPVFSSVKLPDGERPIKRCHDCAALPGHIHHWGCDMERCPKCGMQLISCDCEEVYIDDSDL